MSYRNAGSSNEAVTSNKATCQVGAGYRHKTGDVKEDLKLFNELMCLCENYPFYLHVCGGGN